jgi:hydrogenase maturation factor
MNTRQIEERMKGWMANCVTKNLIPEMLLTIDPKTLQLEIIITEDMKIEDLKVLLTKTLAGL